MEKKTFIEPEVTKVEFEFSDVIAASGGCDSLVGQSLQSKGWSPASCND